LKPEVLIRADGGSTVGLGHLVRCFALAHMLKVDFQITFFCKAIPCEISKEFKEAGFELRKIKNEEEFFQELRANHIAVLDGYDFDTDYQRKIKEKGCKLVCVDDLHNQEIMADLIINHTPGIIPDDYKTQPYACFALGPDYALLRPAFLYQAKRGRKVEKLDTLLIAFGGADPKNLTLEAVKAALKFDTFKKIIIVTGAAYEIKEGLLQLVSSNQRIEHRHAISEEKMMKTMLETDLAILPASGVLIEALATGCMVIAGRYAENQKFVYGNFKNAGFFLDAGNFAQEEVREAISRALTQPLSGRKVIDGNSKERISKIFKEIQRESSIKLRYAGKEDLKLTFRWAANPSIRRFSFQQHKITITEHTDWFLRKINHPYCVYLIGETGSKPFGSIRFDIEDTEAIISFLVDPAFHGQGLGLLLLKKGIENLMFEKELKYKNIEAISGFVMKPNIQSIKVFDRLGFSKVEFADKYKFIKKI